MAKRRRSERDKVVDASIADMNAVAMREKDGRIEAMKRTIESMDMRAGRDARRVDRLSRAAVMAADMLRLLAPQCRNGGPITLVIREIENAHREEESRG